MATTLATVILHASTVPVKVVGEPAHDWWFYLSILFAFFTVVQAAIYFWQLQYQRKLFTDSQMANTILSERHEFEKIRFESERPQLRLTNASWSRSEKGTSPRSLSLRCTFENDGARPALAVKLRAVYVRADDLNLLENYNTRCAKIESSGADDDTIQTELDSEKSDLENNEQICNDRYTNYPYSAFRGLEIELRKILSVTDYEFNDPSSEYYRNTPCQNSSDHKNIMTQWKHLWAELRKVVGFKTNRATFPQVDPDYVEPAYEQWESIAAYMKNEVSLLGRRYDDFGNKIYWRRSAQGKKESGNCDTLTTSEIRVIRPHEISDPVVLIDLDIWQLTAADAKEGDDKSIHVKIGERTVKRERFDPPNTQWAIYWTAVHNDYPPVKLERTDPTTRNNKRNLSKPSTVEHIKEISPYSGSDGWIRIEPSEEDLAFLENK